MAVAQPETKVPTPKDFYTPYGSIQGVSGGYAIVIWIQPDGSVIRKRVATQKVRPVGRLTQNYLQRMPFIPELKA